MATSFRQQSRNRKFLYLGLIVALFTLTVVHRGQTIEPQANYLQLREVARGEAELSGAAVRLLLTGSSGLATTFLWSYALDLQERHQFNELKLVVESITRLQPHFSTPWIFQSWNLSFNVSVEFDMPRDKYFYISEGLNLLARGERVNQGLGADDDSGTSQGGGKLQRGNPDMRWFLGFTYKSKLGTSDENTTMRCLFDLSCIDPDKRNPEKRFLQAADSRGMRLNVKEFEAFCTENPRLVRRLHDGLGLTDPMKIVQFLGDNFELPSRFVFDPTKGEYKLKNWKDQFPTLPLPVRFQGTEHPFPPPDHPGVPDPNDPLLCKKESPDPFVASRTWYEYAQFPLPPPSKNPSFGRGQIDELRHRLPQRGMIIIFRQYPARAQAYVAEHLEKEGWFDREGWDIRSSLEKGDVKFSGKGPLFVGANDLRYEASGPWNSTYEYFKDFGEKNGLYLSPAQRQELEQKAEVFRRHRPDAYVSPGALVDRRPDEYDGPVGVGYDAHIQLAAIDSDRAVINYDDFLAQADAERDPPTIQARKAIFEAEHLKTRRNLLGARTKYEEALGQWRDILLRNPRFAQIGVIQEEVYGNQLDLMTLIQTQEYKELTHALGAVLEIPLPVPAAPMGYERMLLKVLRQIPKENDRFNATVAADLVRFPYADPLQGAARVLVDYFGSEVFLPQMPVAETLFREAGSATVRFRNARGPLERAQLYDGPDAALVYAGMMLFAPPLPDVPPLGIRKVATRSEGFILVREASRESLLPGWGHLLTNENINVVRNARTLPIFE